MSIKRVIFLITYSPPYTEWANLPKPECNWTTASGNWVGISGLEWGDQQLKALVDNYPGYICEVWQPDLRAEKIYSAQLQDRLVHRAFPAMIRKVFKRGKILNELYSNSVLEYVREYNDPETVFMIPAKTHRVWVRHIIKAARDSKLLYYHYLNVGLLLDTPIKTVNPFKAINRWLISRETRRGLRNSKNLLTTNNNPEALIKLMSTYPALSIFLFHNGMDLEFWRPVVSKQEARKILGIPADRFIIVLSQRLIPPYQVDRFIEVLARIRPKRAFSCYITGHGLREYEAELAALAKKHDLLDIVHFVGRVPEAELRNYFIAADLFASVPVVTAGSDGAKKSMAVGTPVLNVCSGSIYEFLVEHSAGEYVSPTDYDSWVAKLEEIIAGKPVKTVSRQDIENYFSWKSTAQELHHALQNLV